MFSICWDSSQKKNIRNAISYFQASSNIYRASKPSNADLFIFLRGRVPDPGYTHAMMKSQLPYNERETLLQI